jgi:hypothetical protein
MEYPIPRRQKRIDCALIIGDVIFVVEFKDGESLYNNIDKVQVEDYCLDLRDFHSESRDRIIVPVLLASNAKALENKYSITEDSVKDILLTNTELFAKTISEAYKVYSLNQDAISYREWDNSSYAPTPTIIEAAQSLYAGQSVEEITRSHAGVENLTKTSNAVIEAIKKAQETQSKLICFITGVPGAGKTLAGLNIVHNKSFSDGDKELGVFLSGNGPLVKVLTEALARDSHSRNGGTIIDSRRRVSTFIHNVHRFIDEYFLDKNKIPVDRVVVFDEAQRAWDAKQSNRKFNRNFSEAEMMLDIMDRHDGWAVVVALVGGGQEINDGEAGLPEWGKTIEEKFPHWKVCVSRELRYGDHSTGNLTLFASETTNVDVQEIQELHLNVSLRAFRARELSNFVSSLINNQPDEAKTIFIAHLREKYPLFITRSLEQAKEWLHAQQKGSRRIGLVATSGGRRLRPFGLDVKADLNVADWFLNPPGDVRSSFALEVPATEFAIQGLELDWVCLCWDTDLRRNGNHWQFKEFRGTTWTMVRKPVDQQYILNKYRVLLTRAREGMIIWVPEGDADDDTRNPEFYDAIFNYLKSCGIPEIE